MEDPTLIFLTRREGKVSVWDHWPESVTEQMSPWSGRKQRKVWPAGNHPKGHSGLPWKSLESGITHKSTKKSEDPLQSNQCLVGPKV